jgi:hypothetical protein
VWLLAGNFFFAPTGDFHQKIELTAKQNKKKKKKKKHILVRKTLI